MESNSSHTDGSESESDRDCSDSGYSDDEDPEVWYEDVDDLFEDVANDEPLSEPIRHRSSSTQTLIILLQWFIYFSLYLLRKFVNLERDNFVKFAVCPKCASLFWRSDCLKYL